jgi:hypothetical protein
MPNSERNAQHLEKRIHLTGKFLGEILWLKLVVNRAIVKKYDELRVFMGYLSDTRSERPIQHINYNNT